MTTASEVKGSAPDHNDGDRDYKQKYTTLKRKLRSLVYVSMVPSSGASECETVLLNTLPYRYRFSWLFV